MAVQAIKKDNRDTKIINVLWCPCVSMLKGAELSIYILPYSIIFVKCTKLKWLVDGHFDFDT